MLKEACNNTLPAPECFLPTYTVPWDSSKSIVQVTQEIYFVSVTIFGIPITCIGLVTSLLCAILFIRYPITQQTTRLLLIANSIVDTLYLATLSISRVVTVIVSLGKYENMHLHIFDGISNFLALFRNWTIILIAFERFMLICHPMALRSKANDKWAIQALIGAIIGSLIVRIPTVLTIIFEELQLCNAATISFSIDAFADILFFTILPLILLTAFTVRILTQARRLRHWRKTRSAKDKERNMAFDRINRRIHRTIMIVLTTFTILITPFLPNGIIRMIIALGNHWCLVYLARHITAAMAYNGSLLNSTINCFVYLITWPKFRAYLRQMLLTPFSCLFGENPRPSFSEEKNTGVTGEQSRSELQNSADYTNDSRR
ncbi:gpcr rhodopsin superfamily [Echinococcus multilocularis]|uniref:Tm gpcr rhodopsin n=1 Tax=Echinococcus multilocularis TaxID=6211 RepID=A0A068YCG1_ECHMU|nr:gpcr rhodopsin superfamily [Echinococcus multilocularis]